MKVLYYDCWLLGYKYVLKIDKYFSLNNHERKIIHTSDWYNYDYIDAKNELEIQNIEVINAKEYNNNLLDAIKNINPTVLISFDIESLIDRSIVLICKKLNIPIIYLAHGNIAGSHGIGAYKLNTIYLKKFMLRLYRNFKYIIPNYINAKTNNGYNYFETIKSLFILFSNPGANIFLGQKFTNEIDANLFLVYNINDKKFLIDHKKVNPKKIKIIGDPNIFGYSELISNSSNQKYVLYIDDGYVNNNFWTVSEWYTYLKIINEKIRDLGLILKIRLHPRTNEVLHKKFLGENKIEICRLDLLNSINNSTFCINISSSCVFSCILLNKIVFAPFVGVATKKYLKYHDPKLVFYINDLDQIDNYATVHYEPNYREEFLTNIGYNKELNTTKLLYEFICSVIK